MCYPMKHAMASNDTTEHISTQEDWNADDSGIREPRYSNKYFSQKMLYLYRSNREISLG